MKTKHFTKLFLCCLYATNLFNQFSNPHFSLKVSANDRYLQIFGGKSFFG